MSVNKILDDLDAGSAVLEPEWMITIDTPDAGVASVLDALEKHIPLTQARTIVVVSHAEVENNGFDALKAHTLVMKVPFSKPLRHRLSCRYRRMKHYCANCLKPFSSPTLTKNQLFASSLFGAADQN